MCDKAQMKCTWDNDALLGDMIRVEFVRKTSDYEVFKLVDKKNANNVVAGVHMKCPHMGTTMGGATGTTFRLLDEATERNWSLEVIFAVGCCEVNMENPGYGDSLRGAVLLSSNLEDYLGQGKTRDIVLDPQMYQLSPAWTSYLSEMKFAKPLSSTGLFRNITVKEVHKIQTGQLAIKDTGFGKMICAGISFIGLGIEGSGTTKALVNSRKRTSFPYLAVVKGISNCRGADKDGYQYISVFGSRPMLREDEREEVATFHAITLVTRCAAVKLLNI